MLLQRAALAPTLALLGSLSLAATGCSSAPGSGENAGTTDNSDGTTSATEALSSSNKYAFDFLVSSGLTDEQAAGVVGNLDQESGMDPTISEYGGGPGRGIAQWSAGGRWNHDANDNVVWFAQTRGESPYSLHLQLEFVMYELKDRGYGYSQLRNSGSVAGATIAFQDYFEMCGACNQTNRIHDAEAAFRAFAHSGGGGGGQDGCFSQTKDRQMPDNACLQSKFDHAWYQCNDGSWTGRWSDPEGCNGVYPL